MFSRKKIKFSDCWKVLIFFLAPMVLLVTPVKSQEALSFGNGIVSCGTVVSEMNDLPQSYAHEAWVNGFLSGINAAEYGGRRDVGSKTDVDGRWQSILNFCRDNPLSSLQDATIDLYIQILNAGK